MISQFVFLPTFRINHLQLRCRHFSFSNIWCTFHGISGLFDSFIALFLLSTETLFRSVSIFFFFFSIFIVLNRKSITRPFLERKRNSGCEFSGMLWQFSKKHYGGMMSAKKAFRCEWENSADLENLFNRDLCFKEAVAWYFSSPGFTDI